MHDLPKIIYIAGYGRSGSTLLDVVLGNHPMIASLGEVGNIWNLHEIGGRCSCGEKLIDCDFWGGICSTVARPGSTMSAQFAKIEACRKPVSNPNLFGAYADAHRALFMRIAQHAKAPLVVDSSKTSWGFRRRPQALAEAGADVRLIILRRSLASVVSSKRVPNDRQLGRVRSRSNALSTLRAVIGWVQANAAAQRASKELGRTKCYQVSYEAFTADPQVAAASLLRWLGQDPTPIMEILKADSVFNVGHLIEGNRAGRSGTMTLRKHTETISRTWQGQLFLGVEKLFDLVFRPHCSNM